MLSSRALAAIAMVVLVSGCTSNSTAEPGPSTAAVAPSAADPEAGLTTGTHLKVTLLTQNDLPAGFKVAADSVKDSAGTFGAPAKKVVKPTKSACQKLDTNVWIAGAGIRSASFAQTGFTNSHGDEIDAEVDSFRGTDATAVMTNLRQLIDLCSSFTSSTPKKTHPKVTVVSIAGPKVGDDSLEAVLTSPAWQGGSTLVAVRAGQAVVTVLYSSSKSDLGSRAAQYAEIIAKRL